MPGFWFVFRFGGFLHCVESKFEVRLRRPPTILTSNYVALPLPIAHSNLVRIVGRVKLVGHDVRSFQRCFDQWTLLPICSGCNGPGLPRLHGLTHGANPLSIEENGEAQES
jgi:hypothetical protein